MTAPRLSTRPEGDDLVGNNRRRSFLLVAVFVVGLVLLDQLMLYAGNILIRTSYSNEQLLPGLARSDASLFIVGGCRGALGVDPKLLADRLQMNVFNAAVVVEGLGNVDFSTDVVLASHKSGTLLVIVDSGNWQETVETERDAVVRRLPFWDLLAPSEQAHLKAKYSVHVLEAKSGLLRYVGRGSALLRSSGRMLLRKPVPLNDGFAPRPATQSLASSLAAKGEEQRILSAMQTRFMPTQFAEATIEGIVQRAIAGGVKPVLVIVPMHRLWATETVRQQVINRTQAVADKYHIPFLNYWLANDTISRSNELWSDVGHLNQLGAEATTERLSADLAPLLAKAK